MRGMSSFGMPMPLSVTSTMTYWPFARAATWIVPPSGVYFVALSIRLETARSMWSALPLIVGRSLGPSSVNDWGLRSSVGVRSTKAVGITKTMSTRGRRAAQALPPLRAEDALAGGPDDLFGAEDLP